MPPMGDGRPRPQREGPMSAYIFGVQEKLVMTLYGKTLHELMRLATSQFEERARRGLGDPDSIRYERDDQGYWLFVTVDREPSK